MKLTLQTINNSNKKTYYRFELINICYINSYQIQAVNITLVNIFFQILFFKHKQND